jgi:signal transduction histidine kinase
MYPKKNILIDIPAEITLQAHAWLIEIVLKNLLENACKYAGDKANISVIGTAHSLSVIDTWKGIAPEFQQQMFERFRQLEKTEKIWHSFGLGLYLVKTIVQLHKRKIQVESEKGKGCTITIQR